MDPVVKFTATSPPTGGFQVVAHYASGRSLVWGTQKTERGLRSCLTRYAKRYGFTVHKAENCYELTAN